MLATYQVPYGAKWCSKCILCLSPGKMTSAHVIPEALGGKLAYYFLCKDCNDRAGWIIEAHAKEDPRIVISVERARGSLPEALVEQMTKGQRFIADSMAGKVLGCQRNGEFRVFCSESEESTRVPNDIAEKRLIGRMKKSGASSEEIAAAVKRLRDAPVGEKTEIIPGYVVRKNEVSNVRPALDGHLIDWELPLLIAYEFLAGCCLNAEIYHEALDPVRTAILTGQKDGKAFSVELVNGLKDAPFHCIGVEGVDPVVEVVIKLFDFVGFKVDFRCFRTRGERFAYIHDLNTKKHWLQSLDREVEET